MMSNTAVLHYSNSRKSVSGPVPPGLTLDIASSMAQTRIIRWNLTASGPRPNLQGSYHYGMIKPTRTIVLVNSAPWINGKQSGCFRLDQKIKTAGHVWRDILIVQTHLSHVLVLSFICREESSHRMVPDGSS